MNARSRWLKGIAVAALLTGFAALADEASPPAAESPVTPQRQLGAELSAGIRASLTGVTPEIKLPAIEVRPPAPVTIGG